MDDYGVRSRHGVDHSDEVRAAVGDVLRSGQVIDNGNTVPRGTSRLYLYTASTLLRFSAIESSAHPGGYSYGFQYVQPEENDEILRYDKSKVPQHGAGYHHRHSDNDAKITEIEYTGSTFVKNAER